MEARARDRREEVHNPRTRVAALVLAALLSACGGGPSPPAAEELSTLAYVTTECREGPGGLSGRQRLRVGPGDGDLAVVSEFSTLAALRISGICSIFGTNRFGFASVAGGVFQRLGVSPDGSTVVFEVTDEFSILPLDFRQEDAGIYSVSADGTGLRRLGPASRAPTFTFLDDDLASIRNSDPFFDFSRDGNTVVYTDMGPGPQGELAVQVVAMDLRSGERTQLTQLPLAPSPLGFERAPGTCCPRFVDGSEKVVFGTTANADGRHPGGGVMQYVVDPQTRDLAPLIETPPPGVAVLPVIGIAGALDRGAGLFFLLGQAENPFPPGTPASPGYPEVFRREPSRFSRVTQLRRVDTLSPTLGIDGEQIFFVSSANLDGANPTESCQIFSAPVEGGDPRQLTSFREGEGRSVSGCYFNGRPGCSALFLFQDARSGSLVFYSSCDPLGTNPDGGQIFAMRPDGSGLRQLTSSAGLERESDGSVHVELPGPFAYPLAPSGG